MATITWPRQPRSGEPANRAEGVTLSGKYWVRIKNTSGSYVSAIQVTTLARAQTIASRLNEVFAEPGADLDFITPGWENGSYVVLWSGTKAAQNGSIYTNFGNGGTQTAYENLYCGCYSDSHSYAYRSRSYVKVIATVTDADVQLSRLNPWALALQWANAIRNPVNGWNCAKNCTQEETYKQAVGLTIPQLKVPTKSYTGNKQVIGTFYGDGELQPNLTTSNNDFFHCCDLTVARPTSMKSVLALNTWIKVTYGSKSVVARVTDDCGMDILDLSSGGVAYALNCYGRESVTISAP